jgi:hypothetical protein
MRKMTGMGPWVMLRTLTTLTTLATLTTPRPAAAWGFEGHKYIMDAAIPLLPAAIRPFFLANRTSIVEHAIDPDLWRTAGFEQEPPHHFLDMDAYGPYPFSGLPHLQADAVAKYGRETIDKNGTLPWRAEEIYGKLVEAFTLKSSYSRENIKFFSSVIAHYVADAHVPLHACLNHDGQLTGQTGIHSRFETELFDRYRPQLVVKPGALVPVPNAREFVFATLTESFTFVQPVLDADRASVAGKDTYDDAYFTLFFSKARPILERRLADSIRDVASIITAAWEQAGRPALPLEAVRVPRPVKRH